ncbi:MAG: hypothetical protein ACYTDT_12365 [Planctomycetota bacterium]|jgi:hypothetical protein
MQFLPFHGLNTASNNVSDETERSNVMAVHTYMKDQFKLLVIALATTLALGLAVFLTWYR